MTWYIWVLLGLVVYLTLRLLWMERETRKLESDKYLEDLQKNDEIIAEDVHKLSDSALDTKLESRARAINSIKKD